MSRGHLWPRRKLAHPGQIWPSPATGRARGANLNPSRARVLTPGRWVDCLLEGSSQALHLGGPSRPPEPVASVAGGPVGSAPDPSRKSAKVLVGVMVGNAVPRDQTAS